MNAITAAGRQRGSLAPHIRLGRRGERLAGRLLRNLGLDRLTVNYIGPHGEIDIVARDGHVLCFIEVKSRQTGERGRPIDAITAAKKWRICQTAERYLAQLGRPPVPYRFDVIELIFDNDRVVDARYWPAAFTSDDGQRAVVNQGDQLPPH